jgi:hypothetical protein
VVCDHNDKGNIDIGPTHKETTMPLLLGYQFGGHVSQQTKTLSYKVCIVQLKVHQAC